MSIAYFLQLDGIPGGATAPPFKNQIEVTSFNVGVNTSIITIGGGGGSAAGKAVFAPLIFTKPEDIASPHLFVAASSGMHFATATLTAVAADNPAQQIFHVKLSDVIVSGFHLSASAALAEDTVSLNYSKIEWTSSQINPNLLTTPVTLGWDISKNIKV